MNECFDVIDLSRGGQQLAVFSKEIIDLLKSTPNCRLAFSKFIPCYHQHFGRQCRVADYGYNRLLDVFESIPHVLQVYMYIYFFYCNTCVELYH
jgi:meiosis arrest female protein 1